MSTINQSITIAANIEDVYNFLVDPNKIPLVMLSLVGNTNVPELPLKVGDSFNYKYQLYGVMLEGEWIVDALESPTVYEAHTTGDASSNWKYSLSEEEGGAKVTLDLSYDPPASVVAQAKEAVIDSINKKEVEAFLDNLKAALEL